MKPWPRTLVLAILGAAPLSQAGCSKPAGEAGDAAPAPSASGEQTWLSRRDPSWRPPRPTMPPAPGTAPIAARPPDWDLNRDDPARDYALRYAFFTKRYGDGGMSCVVVGPSQPAGDKRRVQVNVAPSCPNAGSVRDVFLIDLAGDRLTVDDKATRDPLAHWPDGSDPEGPPTDTIREIDDMKRWGGALGGVLRTAMLVPVRVQSYGRGTYPVVSLAGWHGNVQEGAPADELRSLAESLCSANGGMPMAVMTAMDRSKVLRINCPAATRWDSL